MEFRLASAEEQAIGLRDDALQVRIGHDREHARAAGAPWRPVVVLRNPVARARGGVAELTLTATIADVAVGPGSAARQGVARRIPPWRVDGVPLQLLSRRERVALTESPRAYPDADRVVEVRALGWVDRLPGYGIATRAQRKGPTSAPPHPVTAGGGRLDNGLLRVEVDGQGKIRLLDLATNRVVDDVVVLEQARDAGDLYTPAVREPLLAPVVRRVRLVHDGPLRGEIAVEYDLRSRGVQSDDLLSARDTGGHSSDILDRE